MLDQFVNLKFREVFPSTASVLYDPSIDRHPFSRLCTFYSRIISISTTFLVTAQFDPFIFSLDLIWLTIFIIGLILCAKLYNHYHNGGRLSYTNLLMHLFTPPISQTFCELNYKNVTFNEKHFPPRIFLRFKPFFDLIKSVNF